MPGRWRRTSASRRGGIVKASFAASSKTTSSDSQTKITIKAFGPSLNGYGADTLVARTLEDYDAAVKFAFKSMQNDGVGQIHGVEVVSWMKNLQFQNAVKFTPQQAIKWTTSTNTLASTTATDGSVQGPVKIRSAATYIVPGSPATALRSLPWEPRAMTIMRPRSRRNQRLAPPPTR